MTKANNVSKNDSEDEDCPASNDIQPLPPSNLKATMPTQTFSSWGDAFQFAASVKPQDLGTFNPPPSASLSLDPTDQPGNVAAISLIAKEYVSSISNETKRKRDDSDANNDDDATSVVDHSANLDIGDAKAKKKKQKKEKKKKKKAEKTKKRKEESSSSSNPTSTCNLNSDTSEPTSISTGTSGSPTPPASKKKSKKDKKSKKEKKAHKKKETETGPDDENDDSTSNDPASPATSSPLEGHMVMHNDEALMVLIDRPKNIVYSMDRNEVTGQLQPIGTLINGTVKITAETGMSSTCSAGDCDFPYPTDPDDHCESPLDSYKDVKPILDFLAKSNSGGKDDLRIYDPYYCNGLVKDNLAEMGYTNVYNVKEDAYKTWDESDSSQPYPEYDVFITNPPYSEDHIERLMKHLATSQRVVGSRSGNPGKPWCLLMPTYVHKKEYFKQIIAQQKKSHQSQPFYLVPKKRYVYLPPKNFREKKDSDVHKKSSPFVSMWYIWGGSSEKNDTLIRAYQKHGDNSCDLARSVSALRDLRRKGKKK